jgi:hypothetical protein
MDSIISRRLPPIVTLTTEASSAGGGGGGRSTSVGFGIAMSDAAWRREGLKNQTSSNAAADAGLLHNPGTN